MEQRNGGDPLAPPRPPKSLPMVHRLRATETPMMSAPLIHNSQPTSQTAATTTTQNPIATPPRRPIITQQLSNLNIVNQQILQQRQTPPPQQVITTAPLSQILQPVTFSRRRPVQQQQQQHHTQHLHQVTTISPASISPIPSLSSSIQNSLETPVSPVTLAAPRPNNERLVNEYVDTPLRLTHSSLSRTQSHHLHEVSTASGTVPAIHINIHHQNNHPHHLHLHQTSIGSTNKTSSTTHQQIVPHLQHNNSILVTQLNQHHHVSNPSIVTAGSITPNLNRISRPTALSISTTTTQPAVTKQPLPSFTKDNLSVLGGLHEDVEQHPTNGDAFNNTITCPTCQQCRCEECQRTRELPSRWVCDNTCLCSAESAIDYMSCLCCVKALYYHCSKEYEVEEREDGSSLSCADDPCSCVAQNRASRWGYLAALSLCLPCLWCYWPMRGCIALCAGCYARHSRHGCRCKQSKLQLQNHTNSSTQLPGGGGVDNLQNSGHMRTSTNHHHHNHHHHHHSSHNHRTNNELTPEKRLLDSSPEF